VPADFDLSFFGLMSFMGFGALSAYIGGLTGLGGGFLLIPLLTLVAGIDIKDAIFFSFCFMAFLSILRIVKNKELLKGKQNFVSQVAIFIMLGSGIAAWIGSKSSSFALNLIFSVLMIGASIYFLLDRHSDTKHKEPIPHALFISKLLFLASGFMSGLLGIGGGVIYVPTLHKLQGYSMKAASQMSFPFVLVSSMTGLAVYFNQRREAIYNISPLLLFFLLLGTLLGSNLVSRTKLSTSGLKIFFAVMIGLMGFLKLAKAIGWMS